MLERSKSMLNSRSGDRIDMKPNIGEVYRVAFDSASSELKDIVGAFEELRARKERIEKVVMALKPLLGAEEAAAAAAAMQSASEAADRRATDLEEVPTYQYQSSNGSSSGSICQSTEQRTGSRNWAQVQPPVLISRIVRIERRCASQPGTSATFRSICCHVESSPLFPFIPSSAIISPT